MASGLDTYARKVVEALQFTESTPPCTIERAAEFLLEIDAEANKIMLVGNGGSAAIASHIAVDLCKTCGIRAMALNDPSMLTCLSNDYSFDEVFSKQVEYHTEPNDALIAISSSGKSKNILNAVRTAAPLGANLITLSGFESDNPLREMGTINFYVPSMEYGVVEIAHLTILHAIADAARVR